MIASSRASWPASLSLPAALAAAPLLAGFVLLLGWLAYSGNELLAAGVCVAGALALVGIRYPHIGLFMLTATLLSNTPGFLKGSGFLTLNNALGAYYVVLLAVHIYRSGSFEALQMREVRILVGVAVVFAATTLMAERLLPYMQPIPGLDRTGEFLYDLCSRLAFLVFFVTFIRTRNQVAAILAVVLVAVLAALPGALAAWQTPELQRDFRVTSDLSWWAENTNRLAFMCNLALILTTYFVALWRRRLAFLAAIPLIGVLIVLTLLTASRSGFLGLGILGVLLLREPRLGRPTRGLAVAAGVFGVVAFLTILSPQHRERVLNLNPYSEHGEGSRSTAFRMETLRNAAAMVADYPVTGIGLGNFRWLNAYRTGWWSAAPHNSYVWALVEGGAGVLVLYLVLFRSLLLRCRELCQGGGEDPLLALTAAAARLSLILFMFFSLFADIWLEVHLYLITGIILVLARLRAEEGVAGSEGERATMAVTPARAW